MKSAVSSKQLAAGWRKILLFCLLLTAYCSSGCSIPNLENSDCEAARNTVRELYSVHFGNDMQPSEDYLKLREKFLTADLQNSISKNLSDKRDYFTATADYPKAFRVGSCEVIEPNKTLFGVLLFWKDDTRNEQREIKVEAVRQNGKWLINNIF